MGRSRRGVFFVRSRRGVFFVRSRRGVFFVRSRRGVFFVRSRRGVFFVRSLVIRYAERIFCRDVTAERLYQVCGVLY
ncbi:MAG: hypothetical protein KME31_17070 [Tolypothrix carrinoi HA7290-LM1]|nr:hypothetical protein [Tolypothrix carrinoi HA7290-LM1]